MLPVAGEEFAAERVIGHVASAAHAEGVGLVVAGQAHRDGEGAALRQAEARERFARIPQAVVIEGPGSKHLWIGETSVRQALQGIAHVVVGPEAVLPTEWDGPMERWNDLA